MYPNHPHYYPVYVHGGGVRRIWWFVLGGVAATLWLKFRERERCNVDGPRGWWRRGELRDSRNDGAWSEERDRLARIGSQAGDTVADVSEAALDSVLTTVEALKKKLAEKRIARQEEHKHEEEPQRA